MNESLNQDADNPNPPSDESRLKLQLAEQLAAFRDFGNATQIVETLSRTFAGQPLSVSTYVNAFWTSKQRQANPVHEVSYRACFKPQVPRFFIDRLTQLGDVVYDPFGGRGTTTVEAALLGRVPCGNDINPLSIVLTRPRLCPPTLPAVAARPKGIPFHRSEEHTSELQSLRHLVCRLL